MSGTANNTNYTAHISRTHLHNSLHKHISPGADVGACGADAPENVADGVADGSFVGENHRLALAGAVLRHPACVGRRERCVCESERKM